MDLNPKSRRALKIKPFKTQEYHIITDENSKDTDNIPTKSINSYNDQINKKPKAERKGT